VLYTSLTREGALAEIAFYWSQLTPLPWEMVESARPVAAQAACVAAQVACVLAQAGWSESDAAYGEVREEFGRVAILVHRDLHGEPGTDPAAQVLPALRVFETWCRERFGAEFPAFLPRTPSSFQPLVDF
jgi:hypothetical protein